MPEDRRRERFIRAKCDRCGKVTGSKFHGEGDLFVLPEEWGEGLADQGAFCESCIERYSPDNWREWLSKRTPGVRAEG